MKLRLKITKPRINLIVIKPFAAGGKLYKMGHKFHVIGINTIGGYDIKDDLGNEIYKIGFLIDNFAQVIV